MPTSLVLQNDQAAINGIRRAGATQLILAPGNGYTGGHSWFQYTCSDCEPSSEYLYQIKDPLRNTAIDIHEYLDYDFSGQHQACTQPAPSNLANLTTWLAQHNLKVRSHTYLPFSYFHHFLTSLSPTRPSSPNSAATTTPCAPNTSGKKSNTLPTTVNISAGPHGPPAHCGVPTRRVVTMGRSMEV